MDSNELETMTINRFTPLITVTEACGYAAYSNGWWDRWFELTDTTHNSETLTDSETEHLVAKVALIGTEVSEAIEEIRKGNAMRTYEREDGKPEGFAVELADVLIRTLDLADMMGFDMGDLVARKLEFNRTRGHMHGGKTI